MIFFIILWGALLDSLLIIGILECVEQKRLIFKSIMKSLAIPLVIGVLFVTILTAYSTKELGNMPILPAQKQSMKNRTVNLEIELSNESSTAALYQNKSANQIEHGKQIADALRLNIS